MNAMWSVLTDYLTPHRDNGVSLPSGTCKLIHVNDKHVELLVKQRKYLQSRVCPNSDCKTTTERIFFKTEKRKAVFASGRLDQTVWLQFEEMFVKCVYDFASTVKPGKEEKTVPPVLNETWCKHCDEFIHLLEFGQVTALNKYTREEFDKVQSCSHGGQAVGHHMSFFMYWLLHFYINTKVLLYNNVGKICTLNSMYFEACDGQTFLPYQRQYLHLWMKDREVTIRMCKVAFRCIYLYVYLMRKFDPSFDFKYRYSDYFPRYRDSFWWLTRKYSGSDEQSPE